MTPRITIACSGLGHIRRGNETWARDVAEALHQAGVDVLLVGGGPPPGGRCPYQRLPNLRRDTPVLRRAIPWSRRYLAEQLSFLLPLRRLLRREQRPTVHLCDPDLALQLQKRTPRSQLRVAFKDGMLLGPAWCSRIEFVQVLAPYYRDVLARQAGVDTRNWFVIPHLIDIEAFHPPADRTRAREEWPELHLPAGALTVLGIGDFSADSHKRLEWLVAETARLPHALNAHLVVAGQSTDDEALAFANHARAALGSRVRILPNLPRARVARLYQACDVYAHAALREPFGIVFLEAMASGLPVVSHTWEVSQWIVGDAGVGVDMTAPGALAAVLERWATSPMERQELGARARVRAAAAFAPEQLVPRYLELYDRMQSRTGSGPEATA